MRHIPENIPLLETSRHQSCTISVQTHDKPLDTFKTPWLTWAQLQIVKTPPSANWHNQMPAAVKDTEPCYLFLRLAIGQKELGWATLGPGSGTVFGHSVTLLPHIQTFLWTMKCIYDLSLQHRTHCSLILLFCITVVFRRRVSFFLKIKDGSLSERENLVFALGCSQKKWHICEKDTVRCNFNLNVVRLIIGDREDGRKQRVVRKCNY